MTGLYMLDYGAGNVRSLVNAVKHLGYDIKFIKDPADILKADKLIFPGVGAFGHAMQALHEKGYASPLKEYLLSGRPFMGICVGMQTLFEGSEESDMPGLGVIPGITKQFEASNKAVPHMGWNKAQVLKHSSSNQDVSFQIKDTSVYYFVHSFAVPYEKTKHKEWALTTTQYGDEIFISSAQKGNIFVTQFHPEKVALMVSECFNPFLTLIKEPVVFAQDTFTKRIIACLDVRANDNGDLVVTKGDQYDVREKLADGSDDVRNLGKPVDLAKRYFEEGADEITFLNITSFRNCPLGDAPMLEVLRRTSETVFVPLTIGGGIRDVVDPDGTVHPAFEVAGEYFRSGADKVSIGSDAVFAVEKYLAEGKDGKSAIETIAKAYGSQAVVISVDPRRVYVNDPTETTHHVVKASQLGPKGEQYCWYQCTVKGGREGRDLDVCQLVTACQALGAEVFEKTKVEAALAAGIFHRHEVPIQAVKDHLKSVGVNIRSNETEL
ncbi:class I glutamine amidotransferase-like protein [Absidia repens]|uniref:Class I glutamine amidotransferase-like protein n=1 Tax=Absidia repens TaxID=90262 RepID=A0A1X2IRQ4_9FUNG|nr:class I glutamine amidotransferase-like protein [Absidia repens]